MEDWRRLEKDLARKLDMQLTVGSGNKWQKGDAQSSLFIAEAKWRSPHLDLMEEWLVRVSKQAEARGKHPMLCISCNNMWTYCLVSMELWGTEPETSLRINCKDVGQKRLHGSNDYRHNIFEFSTGDWICLSWDEARELVKALSPEVEEKEKQPWVKKKFVQDEGYKERQRQKRKDSYQYFKELRKKKKQM